MSKPFASKTLKESLADDAIKTAFEFACQNRRKDGVIDCFVGYAVHLQNLGVISKPSIPSQQCLYFADVRILIKDGYPLKVDVERVITKTEYEAEEKAHRDARMQTV